MRGDCKRQPHIHAARITFGGCVEKLLHVCETNDLIELTFGLGLRHAKDGSVEIDVFATSQLGMEAGAHFEQARQAPSDNSAAFSRLRNPREDFQQCRFTGAILPYDAEYLPALHFK